MEQLKKLEEINLPDRRSDSFVICNQQTGQQRKYQLEDLYREVKSIELNECVPEDVRSQFNVREIQHCIRGFAIRFIMSRT